MKAKWVEPIYVLDDRLIDVFGKREAHRFKQSKEYELLRRASVFGWPFLIKRERKRTKVVVLKAKIV